MRNEGTENGEWKNGTLDMCENAERNVMRCMVVCSYDGNLVSIYWHCGPVNESIEKSMLICQASYVYEISAGFMISEIWSKISEIKKRKR